MQYNLHQKNYMRNRYQNDQEFRKRMIRHITNYQMRHPFKTWANRVISSHRYRNITIKITRLELEETASRIKFCAFCGCELKYGKQNGQKKWHYDSASADRIDNTKPLSKDNLEIICVQCNSAKSKLSIEEFRDWVKKVYINFSRKSYKGST